ncbi:vWA domain-containing protein [Spirosoma rigui]|uniref:hypothetical protein n=1 Tax=Spirosoma rigui TaxID=564064 RepID=UPI0009AFE385|nr:hypothetical protein [Spirosoma rigui]
MTKSAQHQIFNLIILDESGSMESIKTPTLTGFNEMVQTIKGAQVQFPDQQHYISLVAFNGLSIRTLLDRLPVDSLYPLTTDLYRPDASTPLYDAMGRSLLRLELQTEHLTNYSVLVSILTDGDENASREFGGAAIRAMVDRLTKLGWSFTYMGANHNVEQTAALLAIHSSIRFESTQASVEQLFDKDRKGRMAYYDKRSKGMSSEQAQNGYWEQP